MKLKELVKRLQNQIKENPEDAEKEFVTSDDLGHLSYLDQIQTLRMENGFLKNNIDIMAREIQYLKKYGA